MSRKPRPTVSTGPVAPCVGCGGNVPTNSAPGAYPGAVSRFDGQTEICLLCGRFEEIAAQRGIRLTSPGRAASGIVNVYTLAGRTS